MINLDDIPTDVRLARGDYSIVRAAHEDEKQRLSVLCGNMQTILSTILLGVQKNDGLAHDQIDALITEADSVLTKISHYAQSIQDMARQREELKLKAWGK